MRSFLSIVAAPALCLGVLGGITWENGRHAKPADAEPFHADAREAVARWTPSFGPWVSRGNAEKLPDAAQKLLKPNAVMYREYVRPGPRGGMNWFDVLVVQCKTATDMSGHYPPNCKKQAGSEMTAAPLRRDWHVPGLATPVVGYEYHFGPEKPGDAPEVIYNFFILPGRGFTAEMADVREATGDYQRKYLGATQVQVRFRDPADEKAREEAFVQLLAANAAVLRKLERPGP